MLSHQLEAVLSLNDCLESIEEVLSEPDLSATKSLLIRDVVNVVWTVRVLAIDAADLQVEGIGKRFQLLALIAQVGQLDVH